MPRDKARDIDPVPATSAAVWMEQIDRSGYLDVSTREKWERARQVALTNLGLTWEQLEDQAREERFTNGRAQNVWLTFSYLAPRS